MLLALFSTLVVVASALTDCDLTGVPDAIQPATQRICRLETEVAVLGNALQELLQRTDITLPEEEIVAPAEKRKNEFIRFGKRSATNEKRKNEFIRFGKRKNEFIRFGRSDPSLSDDVSMAKRKNEFIRFG